MNTSSEMRIVVGFDGSAGAVSAALWAAGEAVTRKLAVTIVSVDDPPLAPQPGDIPRDSGRVRKHRATEEIVDRLRHSYSGLDVRTEHAEGSAAVVLVEASRHASLVVVGARRLGAFGALMLGSVSAAVATGASCPVVVVRQPGGSQSSRVVVVGVNIAEDTHGVLEYAFEYASSHDVALRVVMCAQPDVDESAHGVYAHVVQRELEPHLADAMRPWQEKYPHVTATGAVIVEHPVAGLFKASVGAELLVVGTHGRRPVIGGLLGSVSQGVLHHAQCPVAVVPLQRLR